MQRPLETRPSGAHRWTKCSAAPRFASLSEPQPEGDAAKEGTCAAWLAEMVLLGQAISCRDLRGATHENGWEVDDEMVGHIQGYVDMIHADGGFISAERHVTLSPLVAGTLDSAASFTNGVVKVRDLKYGFRLIEADAEQLVIYAAALVQELQAAGHHVREVWTEIYQPRGFHPEGIHRRVVWSVEDIMARGVWIAERAVECHKPEPLATPGPHCAECEGATGCAALAATSENLIALVESNQYRPMSAQDAVNSLEHLREAAKLIGARVKAVESEALARAQNGERFPGYGMKERLGNRRFKYDPAVVQMVTGVRPYVEKEMSPAQLKAAGASEAMIAKVTHRPITGHKLEKLDPRDLLREFPAKG